MAATRRQPRVRRRARSPKPPRVALRRRLLMVLMASALVATVGGAFYRQVVENDFLKTEGERRHLRLSEIPARRGMIFDRHGEPLAVSTPVTTYWADPRVFAAHEHQTDAVARALNLDAERLRERFESNRGRAFMYLKRRVHPREAEALDALIAREGIQGIGTETEYRRFYPSAEVFGHVLGFTDIEDQGQEGLERAFEAQLSARPGLRRVIQDGRRTQVAELELVRLPRDGRDLTVSLDRRLQFIAYRELKRAVAEHKALGGSAVILDVQSGEILAMVNQPGYNPNAVREGGVDHRRNRALTDVFEPGSTVKPFIVLAALELSLVGPHTTIDTRPGVMTVGRNRVRDVRDFGVLDTTGVITRSSNIGVVKLAQRMDRSVIWQVYDRVGFGSRTDSGFPGESPGVLPHFRRWSQFDQAVLSFGYGLSTTALQLAQSYAVLAADGVKRPVTLIKRDGPPPPGVRVLGAQSTRQVRAMMETVVSSPQGTARRAAIEGYRVAGKTGTSKKSAGRQGYTGNRYQAVFAGMVPVDNPRFVMVVMIDEPRGASHFGGQVAAPVFARVMENAVRLYNVPPDDPAGSLLLVGTAEVAQ
ncbi:penicillin-binding protein 2 [Thioalkalicoccus limnaeus]|uniref:Peptidoglycan D,D-transpeptidase FtsI n=1 Tax=Thioalkalicoccus limnaeus TaxID=120681 RepID=A0ABV4BB63_9GAMM